MRKQFTAFMCAALVGGMAALAPSVAAGVQKVDGFLFSKLQAVGSKSEGPAYFLQRFDEKEVPIMKHSMMWQADPVLQALVGKKVTVEGEMIDGVLTYTSVRPYEPRTPEP